MKALALLHASLTVRDLDAAISFYAGALGFAAETPTQPPAHLFGAASARGMRLRRGRQALELVQFDPPGADYPPGSRANDAWFQHCALATDDIGAALARLDRFGVEAISRQRPSRLPGGIVACKFRDPDGHPLELIGFPAPDPATAGGIDHCAIAVADAQTSIRFYADRLGLTEQARQVNQGPAQDALDGLDGVIADVVALAPAQPAPHLELLGYRQPPGRTMPAMQPRDIAASRLVFRVDRLDVPPDAPRAADGSAALWRDPDGHRLLLTVG